MSGVYWCHTDNLVPVSVCYNKGDCFFFQISDSYCSRKIVFTRSEMSIYIGKINIWLARVFYSKGTATPIPETEKNCLFATWREKEGGGDDGVILQWFVTRTPPLFLEHWFLHITQSRWLSSERTSESHFSFFTNLNCTLFIVVIIF